ncbi:omega-amidase NIT2-like [Paramacrobiotus metropolitanus]|uniref:omega-amidase NIT2-like n=1 Tax=Paramacrobiotus metropolitanus TaxID=2943436 RepID=UPI002445B8AE|nr:omega-amidase NIT2-like [Paramacrobiotus metropolitanus]
MSASTSELRLIVIQMQISYHKGTNLTLAADLIKQAVSSPDAMVADIVNGQRTSRSDLFSNTLIVLPEFFNSPYDFGKIAENAEHIPGPTTDAIGKIADLFGIYVIAGSIPEVDGKLIYNTCVVFDPNGKIVAKHRKMHMFDADLPGGRYCESDVFASGSSFTTFQAGEWKVGLGVCHDVRFPEMATAYALQGCHMIVYPSAFEMVTGKAHWKLALQARALDNQIYVVGAAPARHDASAYPVWGHSALIGPWADVIAEADEKESILRQVLDLDAVRNARQQIPLAKQRRTDCYRNINQ